MGRKGEGGVLVEVGGGREEGKERGGGIVDDWMALSQHSKMGTFRVLFDRYEVWR